VKFTNVFAAMWESFVTQLLSFWIIACAFGCYFSIADHSESL
jgi:hypothetical protein